MRSAQESATVILETPIITSSTEEVTRKENEVFPMCSIARATSPIRVQAGGSELLKVRRVREERVELNEALVDHDRALEGELLHADMLAKSRPAVRLAHREEERR